MAYDNSDPNGVNNDYGYTDQSQPADTTTGVNPTDAWKPQIQAWYQQYLGRPASDSDVQSHLGNPGGLTGIEAAIKGSPEATAYAASQGKKTTTGTTTDTQTYADARSMIDALLKQGVDPSAAVDQVNQKFNLPSGSSLAYYAPGAHGPGSGAVIGLPSSAGGGYLASDAGGAWGWNAGESGGNSGGGASWFDQNAPSGQYTQPYTTPDGEPAPYQVPGGGPSPYAVPQRPSAIAQPFVPQVWTDKFNAPTQQDLQNTPGFLETQDAAQQSMERAAASNGSILSGGFVGRALPRALGQLAGQQYQQLYNNAYQTYQDRYKSFQDANNNALNAYAANVGGYNADVGNALSAFNANENTYQNNVQNGLQQYNAQQGAYQNAVNNSLNQYDKRYQAYQDLIKNNLSYAQLGLNAAQSGNPGGAQ